MEEIIIRGSQAPSLNEIIKKSTLSKGAFYYHFSSKEELLEALAIEAIKPWFLKHWIQVLNRSKEPMETIRRIGLRQFSRTGPYLLERQVFLILCNDLSYLNDGLQLLINSMLQNWQRAFSRAIAKELRAPTIGLSNSHIDELARIFISFFLTSSGINLALGFTLEYKRSFKFLLDLVQGGEIFKPSFPNPII